MKQIVVFSQKDIEEVKAKVKGVVGLIKGQPMISHIDYMVLTDLGEILDLLNREE